MIANAGGEDTAMLVERFRDDPTQALAGLFRRHDTRLRRLVQARMDPRLAGRVSADDILQEAYLDAANRLDHFVADIDVSPAIWLRMVVGQTIVNVHRRHLGTKKRDAAREVNVGESDTVTGEWTRATRGMQEAVGPLQAAIRAEQQQLLDRALDRLGERDRQILMLRHFAELSNTEVATLLGIKQKAASIRYVRALARLRTQLERHGC